MLELFLRIMLLLRLFLCLGLGVQYVLPLHKLNNVLFICVLLFLKKKISYKTTTTKYQGSQSHHSP